MRTRVWTAIACSILTASLALPTAQAGGIPSAKGWESFKAEKEKEGWQEITAGVLERKLGEDRAEVYGVGKEGLAQIISDLVLRHRNLKAEYLKYPSRELAQTIDELALVITQSMADLAVMPALADIDFGAITAANCSSICFGATANALALTATQGVTANATASFNSTCGYSGSTYAYAYARATSGTTTTTIFQQDPKTGPSITSNATATANGGSIAGYPCHSEANSYATSTALGISYSTSASNNSCPIPPLPVVTINGSTYEYFFTTGCRNVTWTSTVTGGDGPHSYQWKYDGTNVASGTSYTRVVCPGNYAFTLSLVVTNSSGSGTDTHGVLVEYDNGGCLLPLPCLN